MKIQDLKVGDRVKYKEKGEIKTGELYIENDKFYIVSAYCNIGDEIPKENIISKLEPRTVWIPKEVTEYKEIPIKKEPKKSFRFNFHAQSLRVDSDRKKLHGFASVNGRYELGVVLPYDFSLGDISQGKIYEVEIKEK